MRIILKLFVAVTLMIIPVAYAISIRSLNIGFSGIICFGIGFLLLDDWLQEVSK